MKLVHAVRFVFESAVHFFASSVDFFVVFVVFVDRVSGVSTVFVDFVVFR